jgi:hypothetical protein
LGSKAWSGVKNVAGKAGKFISSMNPMKALKDGLIGKAGKFIGKAAKGGLIGALLNAGQIGAILAGKGSSLEKAQKIIPVGAGIIGGALGSVLGSILPGPGTILGGMAGGLIGDWIGGMPSVQKALAPPLAKVLGGNDVADDFVMQGGKVQRFRKDDIVIGGTKPFQGDQQVMATLVRIANALEKGGDVIIDGQKVGRAVVAGSYRLK